MRRQASIHRPPHNDHTCIKRSPNSDESFYESAMRHSEYGCGERRRTGEGRECAAVCGA